LIEEEFGDGIMSAIDFDFAFERLPQPKGDHVKITMSGKFLPSKYYGNEQGIPEYGFKESWASHKTPARCAWVGRGQTRFSAWVRSAIRSSGCSRPIDRRTRPSATPMAARVSGEKR
jgi:hypothetical protein